MTSSSPAIASTRPNAQLRQAGFVSRLLAFLLDVAFVSLGSLVFAGLVSMVLNFFGLSVRELTLEDTTRSVLVWIQVLIAAIAGLSVLGFVPAYFILCWVLVGTTPGKRILGLKVIRTKNARLGWGRAIIRFVGYWISALCLFVGFLWVLVDRRRQAWHDKLADTFVVYEWPELPGEYAPGPGKVTGSP